MKKTLAVFGPTIVFVLVAAIVSALAPEDPYRALAASDVVIILFGAALGALVQIASIKLASRE